jgi:large conductance mechanosensitive channel
MDRVGTGLRAGGQHTSGILSEFRTFVLRGNVIDLAIAVVIGVAFTAVVSALVKDLLTPLIAALGAKPDFASLTFTINHSRFLWGDFVNAVVSFLIIAAVLFFLIVLPMNRLIRLTQRRQEPPPAAPTTRECTECLSKIPLAAKRCAFCTSPQTPVEAAADTT